MKKEYIIGLLTGCLLTASALMFMGATDNDSQIGRYEMSIFEGVGGGTVYRLVDTTNGQRYKHNTLKNVWKKTGKPVQD